jgi:hypothetical protein
VKPFDVPALQTTSRIRKQGRREDHEEFKYGKGTGALGACGVSKLMIVAVLSIGVISSQYRCFYQINQFENIPLQTFVDRPEKTTSPTCVRR